MLPDPHEPSEVVRAALARNDLFLVDIVEEEGLCPFARGTRLAGQLAREVVLGQPTAAELARRAAAYDDEQRGQIVLLILPEFSGDARAFERLCEAVRRVDAGRRPARFAMAPFHPEASYGIESAAKMVGLFRRAPDPTLQLVRHTTLEAARRRAPDGKFFFDGSVAAWAALAARPERGLSEQIAHDNWERHKRLDQALAARLRALCRR